MAKLKELPNRRIYHYLVVLLEDLDRDSYKFLRSLCQQEIDSYDELIEGYAAKIASIPDDELKEFKAKIVNKKNQQEVMRTLLDTYLDMDFVKKRAEALIEEIRREEAKANG